MSKNLSGNWYNELGSTMNLTADDNGGLSGKYHSAVGEPEDWYILTGRFDTRPPSEEGVGISVGWVVTFSRDQDDIHSTTTWSGQYFDDGTERIVTNWLLTKSTDPKDMWNSTNIGRDTFTRTKPSAGGFGKHGVHVRPLKTRAKL